MNFKTIRNVTVGLSILAGPIGIFYPQILYFALIPIAIGFVIITLGAFHIQWDFFLKAIHQGDPSRQQIALTFDDGPHLVYTPQVLELLKKHQVNATFFCIGKHVAAHPALAKDMHEQGHLIGNHSFSHSTTIDFNWKAKWLDEIKKADGEIEKITGHPPRFFRPPYGVTTPHLAQALQETKHVVVGWRVRPYDTVKQPISNTVHNILAKTKAGDIVLLHDTHERMSSILEQLLPEFKRRNFTFATVEQLIKHDDEG